MMFRAQVSDRAQLHFISKGRELDIFQWTEEWMNGALPEAPEFDDTVRTNSYLIAWRLVTNSGQDEDLIRPVIGAGGWPFIPGSTMKGAFRRACAEQLCSKDQHALYCGKAPNDGDFRPGILRFHGGYPVNQAWKNALIDLAHPQQSWQVKGETKSGSAFPVISLKQTKLQFGISSSQPLDQQEWQTIWRLWEQALAKGLGCRVSSGYGFFEGEAVAALEEEILYKAVLKGQGVASTLLGRRGAPEFRPNIFKAALRGHALRLVGGFVGWDDSAEAIVETLFGGIRNKGTQGLLGLEVRLLNNGTPPLREVNTYEGPPVPITFYDLECEVIWRFTKLREHREHRQQLQTLIQKLMEFAMLLGGFGKSWRRADHNIFRPNYKNHPIGCHWQWVNELDDPIQSPNNVTTLINETRDAVWNWIDCLPQDFHSRHEARLMKMINPPLLLKSPKAKNSNDFKTDCWRELWKPGRVEVWMRVSNGESKVIDWLHDNSNYRRQKQAQRGQNSRYRSASQSGSLATQRYQKPKANIYRTTVSGYVGEKNELDKKETRVGRIWHRMYPIKTEKTGKYLELLTFFPCIDSEDTASKDFQTYLKNQREFTQVWGE